MAADFGWVWAYGQFFPAARHVINFSSLPSHMLTGTLSNTAEKSPGRFTSI
jgi:hypothetical protein